MVDWLSGRKHFPAKEASMKYGSEGSNPSSTAKLKRKVGRADECSVLESRKVILSSLVGSNPTFTSDQKPTQIYSSVFSNFPPAYTN